MHQEATYAPIGEKVMKLLTHIYSLNMVNAQTYKIKRKRMYVMAAWYKDNKYNVGSRSEKMKYMYVVKLAEVKLPVFHQTLDCQLT